MPNTITINIDDILKLDDNSITDAETLRQIGLWCTTFDLQRGDRSIYKRVNRKVKRGFEFGTLYPHIMTFDPNVATSVTKEGQEQMRKMLDITYNDRKEWKDKKI